MKVIREEIGENIKAKKRPLKFEIKSFPLATQLTTKTGVWGTIYRDAEDQVIVDLRYHHEQKDGTLRPNIRGVMFFGSQVTDLLDFCDLVRTYIERFDLKTPVNIPEPRTHAKAE